MGGRRLVGFVYGLRPIWFLGWVWELRCLGWTRPLYCTGLRSIWCPNPSGVWVSALFGVSLIGSLPISALLSFRFWIGT